MSGAIEGVAVIASVGGPITVASSRRCRSTSLMYAVSASASGMSRPCCCACTPAVLEEFVEHLGGLELAAEILRDRADDGFEHAHLPLVRDHLLVLVLLVVGGAIRVEVVEQAPRLVLAGVQAGEAQQPPLVVPGVDDLRLDAQRRAGLVGADRELLDVEAEVVQAVDALVDAPALGHAEGLAGELLPEVAVRVDDAVRDAHGVELVGDAAAGLEVEQLAGDVDARDLEVVLALAVRQAPS